MHAHFKGRFGHYVVITILFLTLATVALWSWNTLADLFDWPLAQYKHVLAAFILAFAARLVLFHRPRAALHTFPD